MKEHFELDLIDNAKSSLKHAVGHLVNEDGADEIDLKYAIRDVAHVVELLLKERLCRIHPAFVWSNVDKYPSTEAFTVDTKIAIVRLRKFGDIKFSEEDVKTINICRKFRNFIEHYKFKIKYEEAKIVIGRMLSFIFEFSANNLDMDLENDFRRNDTWKALLGIYEFWEARKNVVEEKMVKEERAVCDCPSCGVRTFDLELEECQLCEHHEQVFECDGCHGPKIESELVFFEEPDVDKDGVSGVTCFQLCDDCLYEEERASMYEKY